MSRRRTRWPVRAYNALARAAGSVGLRPGPLTVDRVLELARRYSKLEDAALEGFEEPLGILVDSFEREGKLHPFGRLAAMRFLVGLLVKRMQVVEALKHNPEVEQQKIRRPLFVIGAPRTGTTLLLNLLACDPRGRPLLSWEGNRPAPAIGAHGEDPDPRIRQADRDFRTLKYLVPDLDKIHAVRTESPGEDVGLLQNTLVTWVFLILADLRSYEAWMWEQDDDRLVEAYRFYEKQLQLLQWQCSADHWVLKSPAHLQSMGALLEVFPDACIVQTHRDPAKVLPSSCSLFAAVRGMMSYEVDPHELGRGALEGGARIAQRVLALREHLSPDRVLDVQYSDLVADPLEVVRRINAHFSYEMDDEMELRCRRWIEQHPRHKHGVHRYTLGQYGLRAEEVREAHAAYVERFGVPREA